MYCNMTDGQEQLNGVRTMQGSSPARPSSTMSSSPAIQPSCQRTQAGGSLSSKPASGHYTGTNYVENIQSRSSILLSGANNSITAPIITSNGQTNSSTNLHIGGDGRAPFVSGVPPSFDSSQMHSPSSISMATTVIVPSGPAPLISQQTTNVVQPWVKYRDPGLSCRCLDYLLWFSHRCNKQCRREVLNNLSFRFQHLLWPFFFQSPSHPGCPLQTTLVRCFCSEQLCLPSIPAHVQFGGACLKYSNSWSGHCKSACSSILYPVLWCKYFYMTYINPFEVDCIIQQQSHPYTMVHLSIFSIKFPTYTMVHLRYQWPVAFKSRSSFLICPYLGRLARSANGTRQSIEAVGFRCTGCCQKRNSFACRELHECNNYMVHRGSWASPRQIADPGIWLTYISKFVSSLFGGSSGHSRCGLIRTYLMEHCWCLSGCSGLNLIKVGRRQVQRNGRGRARGRGRGMGTSVTYLEAYRDVRILFVGLIVTNGLSIMKGHHVSYGIPWDDHSKKFDE